jgi:hypothetical protein
MYCAWCLHRFSPSTFIHDKSFPRAWPYPDWLLLDLNDYFNKLYPAPAGFIKLHSEIERVQISVIVVELLLIACGVTLAMPEVWRVFSSVFSRHKQQFTSLLRMSGLKPLRLFRPRFSLRILLIVIAIAPPFIALLLHPWLTSIWIDVPYYIGFTCVPLFILLWTAVTLLATFLKTVGY